MAVSGMAGAAAQLVPVYAEDEAAETAYFPYPYSTAVANPEGVSREGYKFLGWYTLTSDNRYVAGIENADPNGNVYGKFLSKEEADEEASDLEKNDAEDPQIIEEAPPAENAETAVNEGGSVNETLPEGNEQVNKTPEVVPSEGEGTAVEEQTDPTQENVQPEETNAPAEETNTPTDETIPTDVATSTEENVPAEETAPVEEAVPTEDTAPAENAAPAEEVAPTEEAAPAEETAKTEEAAEAAAETETAPAEDEAKDAKADDELQKAGEKYKVTFDVQGHGTAPEVQEVETGKTATKPADPTAEGYTFGGWFADKECKTAYAFTEEVKADTTVYAKWTIKTFTVSFATTRGTAPAAQTVNYGDKATQPALTDTGYTVTGWTTADGKTYDFASAVTADLTLTAQWRPNVYTVHFDPNNVSYASATGATADLSCTYDQEAKLTKNGFARSADWEFIGWNTAANRSGTAYADQAAVKNLTATDGATVTLYAQWRFIYKMLAGAGASVSKLDTRGLTFQTNGFYSLFTGIAVDGTVVAANNYTASAGNYGTFVTLKQDFIKNLSIGQHTIQFLYQDGSVSCIFYVNTSTILNPVQTGDNSNNALWMGLLAGAAILAVGLGLLRKKYKF